MHLAPSGLSSPPPPFPRATPLAFWPPAGVGPIPRTLKTRWNSSDQDSFQSTQSSATLSGAFLFFSFPNQILVLNRSSPSALYRRYTPAPDYSLPDSGSPTFVDFGYNNITFPQPQQQLQQYKTSYNMRFGGIRKPRLGNRCTSCRKCAHTRLFYCSISRLMQFFSDRRESQGLARWAGWCAQRSSFHSQPQLLPTRRAQHVR
jgi:hypothetical protein